MGSLNEISADFEIDVLFTQIWHDPALSFVNLSSECVRNITMESRYLRGGQMPIRMKGVKPTDKVPMYFQIFGHLTRSVEGKYHQESLKCGIDECKMYRER